jgi:hypothetical protein
LRGGLTEVAALGELERRRPEFEARARLNGHRLLEQEIKRGYPVG